MMAHNRPIAQRSMLALRLLAAVGLVVASLAPLAVLPGQDSEHPAPAAYSSTLTFGTGLVTIPVAWVSPQSGDLFMAASMRTIRQGGIRPKAGDSRWDFTETIEAHLGGRLSLGLSLYDPGSVQMGGFAQVLVARQPTFGSRWRPAIAVGVRNVGSSKYQDRFVTGSERAVDVLGDAGITGDRGTFNASPTAYVVATREFRVSRSSFSASLGYGNGLFKEDGGLGETYSVRGTLVPGLFMGGRLAIPVGQNGQLSLMLEDDGFDLNAGANLTFGSLSLGVFVTELEEQKGTPSGDQLANFTKLGVSMAYNASLPGIIRGSAQRARAAEADRALRRLEQEIAQRQIISRQLVADLAKATQAADAAAVAQRQRLVKQLEAEQAALKAAAARLDALTRKPPEQQ